MISTVAALYVDPLGPYPQLVEHWYDAARDARTYDGPWPVVAHPPCGPWGRLRHLYQGGDAQLAVDAVAHVRRYGGVLEHPAYSRLFSTLQLPTPGTPPDAYGGRTIEVQQVDWGHVARKRTWLYMVRVRWPVDLPPARQPTHWISGGRPRKGERRTARHVPVGIKVCSAQQRRRTPIAFARWLIALAATSSVGER